MSRAPRILCVINSLEGGGAERVFVGVAGALAEAFPGGVELATLDATQDAYSAPPGLARTTLDCRGDWGRSLNRLGAHARRRRPDLIVSFLARANCAAIAAGLACARPVMISERVHTTSHFGAGWRGHTHRLAIRAAYPRAARVIAVSSGVAEDLARRYGVSRERLRVIANPLDVAGIRRAGLAPAPIALPEAFLVAVGRLTPNKNFALLIEAFARARPGADLVILGEGPQRAALMRLAAERGVAERVRFAGFLDNPHSVMARAHAYVSASNAEGFPNALAEAMALGLPCVSTDCPAGPAEILGATGPVTGLTQARHGLLVPPGDVEALAAALRLLDRPDARELLARAAALRARDFAARAILARWAQEAAILMEGRRCASA